MILVNKYRFGFLIKFIFNFFSFFLNIIFFGSKKNNKKIISKIVPELKSDEEFGYYNENNDDIPLNCSLLCKNDYSRINYGKIKKD